MVFTLPFMQIIHLSIFMQIKCEHYGCKFQIMLESYFSTLNTWLKHQEKLFVPPVSDTTFRL